jgi:hypothetical protein
VVFEFSKFEVQEPLHLLVDLIILVVKVILAELLKSKHFRIVAVRLPIHLLETLFVPFVVH